MTISVCAGDCSVTTSWGWAAAGWRARRRRRCRRCGAAAGQNGYAGRYYGSLGATRSGYPAIKVKERAAPVVLPWTGICVPNTAPQQAGGAVGKKRFPVASRRLIRVYSGLRIAFAESDPHFTLTLSIAQKLPFFTPDQEQIESDVV